MKQPNLKKLAMRLSIALALIGIIFITNSCKKETKPTPQNADAITNPGIATNTGYATIYPDTNKYIRDNIVAHKERFEHKELNTLLSRLHLSVKSYIPIHGLKPGAPYRCLILQFEDAVTISRKLEKRVNVPSMIIYFENELPGNRVLGLFAQSWGNWNQGEKDYYGKMIVKDIDAPKNK